MTSRRLSILSALLLAATMVAGQVPGSGGSEPEQAAPVAPAHLASARATMTTFLTAMNEGDTDLALETLDLTYLPGVTRSQEGLKVANAMWAAMNKTEFIVVEEIPDSISGDPYVWHDYGEAGTITIAKQDDEAWRFTSDSLSSMTAIYDSVKDDETVKGLTEVQLFQINPASWLRQKMPQGWTNKGMFGAQLWQFIAALVLIAVAFAAGFIIRQITKWIVRSSLKIDEKIASKKKIAGLGRSISLIVNVVLISYGVPFLDLPLFIITPTLFMLTIVNAIGWLWLFNVLWDVFVAIAARRAGSKSKSAQKVIVPIASKFGRFFILIAVIIFFISQMGYNVSALLAGLGIGGLVFALAAKDSVENLFGSITILMEMPFGIGDWVRIGDIDGDVESINLRSTRIRTFQDSLITMPNSTMITSPVENFGSRRRRRIKTTLGLSYDTSPAQVAEFCERVRQMLLEDDRIWNDKRYVYFNDFGESTLDVMLYCFVIAETWQLELEYRDDVLRQIMVIAQEMNIEFAFPTRTLIIPGGPSATPLPPNQ